ncbi:hypothetical protein [Mesorhizobium sp. M0113]|uniref:hypothetical protein n=1 Tax=Mesorhizobium sp. M0113 TaxID=2956881 RepID=UPI003334F012
MRDAKFGAIISQQLRILDPADRAAAIACERKVSRDLVHGLRHPLKPRAQDNGDREVVASQSPKRVDDALAIDAPLQVAWQYRRAFCERDGVRIAKEIGDQRTIAGATRGGGQRPA